MVKPYSNKKKIRGWKRRIKHIEKWKKSNINLDIEKLKETKYDYLKIWIDPFDRLIKRNPPDWFIRKIISAMEKIFFSWEKSLEILSQPYYLCFWLYENNFIKSQIVCAIDYRIEYYEKTFNKCHEKRQFPINKFNNQQFFKKLDVEIAYDEDFLLESDIEQNYLDIIIKKVHKIDNFKNSDGKVEKIYCIKNGYIWLGKIK